MMLSSFSNIRFLSSLCFLKYQKTSTTIAITIIMLVTDQNITYKFGKSGGLPAGGDMGAFINEHLLGCKAFNLELPEEKKSALQS